ncbi:hypothetical protein HanXRQr2_Chr01g0007521 [Helianthus annuus]|uniref:Uncharacterized protein n=1 Tax=Helianthus annuus TaxID=4232 RepID=A0A9K3JT52_HELAN|nr:hypothetical protein HanXRQr2_Chr01g0007521 [Helianthus annuus]KAJ0621412.1 hypothetical protein HanIR_Chr01g0008311 [Helianthus annuus]
MALCIGQYKPYSEQTLMVLSQLLSLDFDNQKWYQSTLKKFFAGSEYFHKRINT